MRITNTRSHRPHPQSQPTQSRNPPTEALRAGPYRGRAVRAVTRGGRVEQAAAIVDGNLARGGWRAVAAEQAAATALRQVVRSGGRAATLQQATTGLRKKKRS